ncbi:MAG: DedA family protein, partial [Alphaproteobacteria bacterium]|nr:DedA family protein [Alphaproteobacteria bacterium]
LFVISFTESFASPIPPDPLMIPMILAQRHRAWVLAFVCTASSVIGGLIGYAIGYSLFETLGEPILQTYGLMDSFTSLKNTFNKWGFWIILLKGLTPIPYKVVTITSGLTNMDLVTFFVASLLSRGLRFYTEAILLWKWGDPMKAYIEKNLPLVTLAGLSLLIGGFALLKFVV